MMIMLLNVDGDDDDDDDDYEDDGVTQMFFNTQLHEGSPSTVTADDPPKHTAGSSQRPLHAVQCPSRPGADVK